MPSLPRSRAVCAASLALSILATATVLESVAAAAEPSTVSAPDARLRIRQLLATNHVAQARVAIGERLAADVSTAERAALVELHNVATAWTERGKPRAILVTEDMAGAVEWDKGFAMAKADLLAGAYERSVRRLDVLIPLAPDLVDAARAGELRSLGRDVLLIESSAQLTTTTSTLADASHDDSDYEPNDSKRKKKKRSKEDQGERQWYGWQTLLADGAAAGVAPFAPLVGLGMYVVNAPIVHLAHGNFAKAGLSAGLRLGGPLVGGLVGIGAWQSLGKCSTGNNCLNGAFDAMFIGAGVAALTVVVIDSFVIAKEKVEPETKADKTERAARLERTRASVNPLKQIQPSLGPRKEGGFELGIAGMF